MNTKSTSATAYPPARPGWRVAVQAFAAEQGSHSRLLSGSLVMLVGYTIVSVINFGYNVAVARLLGPADFGHAAAIVTMLMLFSAITLAYQLVCAKYVAKAANAEERSAVYRWLLRRAWAAGLGLALALVLSSNLLTEYLRLPGPWLLILLAIGSAFYVPLGVRRGGMQGTCAFARLTTNMMIEALVKLLGAVLLMQTGFGVLGAVAAISASVILAYFFPLTQWELKVQADSVVPASFGDGMQAIVFFIGQVIIGNIGILLVKHYFAPDPAGVYAGVALVGRILYFASWSVVTAMFPISAGRARSGTGDRGVLIISLAIVLALSVVFILGMAYFPDFVLQAVFGSLFQQTGQHVTNLMGLYAAATGIYALSAVLMAYEMSRKVANTSWLQLVFSFMVTIGIAIFHRTIREVVVVQLVLMVFLLIGVSVPFFRTHRQPRLQEAA